MWTRITNTRNSYLFAALWVQIFGVFGRLSAIEIPLELMHEGGNGPQSSDYTHRLALPLVPAPDISAEMPPNVEGNYEFTTTNGDDSGEHQESEELAASRSEMPQWLQQTHQHQPDYTLFHNPMQQTHKHTKHHHHHSNRQVHTPTASSGTSPLRRCSIEISSKIPGICQSMGSIGNACVSGDYIDVFNMECL